MRNEVIWSRKETSSEVQHFEFLLTFERSLRSLKWRRQTRDSKMWVITDPCNKVLTTRRNSWTHGKQFVHFPGQIFWMSWNAFFQTFLNLFTNLKLYKVFAETIFLFSLKQFPHFPLFNENRRRMRRYWSNRFDWVGMADWINKSHKQRKEKWRTQEATKENPFKYLQTHMLHNILRQIDIFRDKSLLV